MNSSIFYLSSTCELIEPCDNYGLRHCDFQLWCVLLMFFLASVEALTSAKNVFVFAYLLRRRGAIPTAVRSHQSAQDVDNNKKANNRPVVGNAIKLSTVHTVPQDAHLHKVVLSAEAQQDTVIQDTSIGTGNSLQADHTVSDRNTLHQSRSPIQVNTATMQTTRSDAHPTGDSKAGNSSKGARVNTRARPTIAGTGAHSNADMFYLVAACMNTIYGANVAIRGREYLFDRWPASNFEVQIYFVIGAWATQGYMAAMLCLTLELFIALKAPFWHRQVWTRRRYAVAQALIASTNGFVFYAAGELINPIGLGAYNPKSYTTMANPRPETAVFYYCSLLFENLTFPFQIILNVLTFIDLRRRSRAQAPTVNSNGSHTLASSAIDSSATRARLLKNAELTFILCARYLVVYGLFFVGYVLVALGVSFNAYIYLYACFGLYLNGIGDGYLQSVFNRRFKFAVEELFRGRFFRRIFQIL